MRSFNKYSICLLVTLLCLVPFLSYANSDNNNTNLTAQKIIHILDYIAVEYPEIVKNGSVVDAEEYEEQREFSEQLLKMVQQLPVKSSSHTLSDDAKRLANVIQQKQSGEKIVSLSTAMSLRLIELFKVDVAPRVAPNVSDATMLFQENCAVCHGIEGFGNGPQAKSLNPAPANFHDRERQQHRSVFSLYNTISLGVDGTAMRSFDQLTSEQRWTLAFYVSNFYGTDVERARGEILITEEKLKPVIKTLKQLAQSTPAEIVADYGEDALAELVYLRSRPLEIQTRTIDPIKVAKDGLQTSLVAYQEGDYKSAYELAVAAYLEGYELVEAPLRTVDPELAKEIEAAMMEYRDQVKRRTGDTQVQILNNNIQEKLTEAAENLHKGSLSSSVNFFSAFLILLREGLEAILILAAISAVLIKTGRGDMMRYLHIGWIAALALGGLTWFVAGHFINISGANREVTEGVFALVAAAMLVYVGYWLHNQTYAMQWQQFIRSKISKSLSNSTLTGLAIVAFLAVYREVFESILFFNTLWLQTNVEGQAQIFSGMLTAAILLVLLAWAIFKFSVRLPLKLFFRVNSVFLYLLAIVFAGKGVAALQEAGKLRVDPVNFFQIDALGISPNLESLGIQAAMILAAVLVYVLSRQKLKREEVEA